MVLSKLMIPKGSRKVRKRVGRGGCHGGTSGKGNKGQLARSGGYVPVWFEGGQMPLQRRIPKRGFANIFKQEYAILNVSDLDKLQNVEKVDLEFLKKSKLVSQNAKLLKVLGDGEIKKALHVVANKFSKSAKEKIEKLGGKTEVL